MIEVKYYFFWRPKTIFNNLKNINNYNNKSNSYFKIKFELFFFWDIVIDIVVIVIDIVRDIVVYRKKINQENFHELYFC